MSRSANSSSNSEVTLTLIVTSMNDITSLKSYFIFGSTTYSKWPSIMLWVLNNNAQKNQTKVLLMQTRTTDTQWSIFTSKSQFFELGQTIWADKFWAIWGIFGRTISTHFGTVSPLSIFPINQQLLQQKTKPLYPNPKYLFGIGIWIKVAKN